VGVGSSLVAAKKLNRKFLGIEIETEYCLLAVKRLHLAGLDTTIQGYSDGVFWERNTLKAQKQKTIKTPIDSAKQLKKNSLVSETHFAI